MAVVKMNKLTLVGLNSEKDQILEQLMALGWVQVNSQDIDADASLAQWSHYFSADNNNETIAQLENRIQQLGLALGRLSKYIGDKKPIFAPKRTVTVDEFYTVKSQQENLWSVVTDIMRLDKEQQELINQKNKILNLITTLEPWQALDLPLDFTGTKHTQITLGVIPPNVNIQLVADELYSKVPASYLQQINQDKYQHYVTLICHRDVQADAESVLKKYGFNPVNFSEMRGTVAANLAQAKQEIQRIDGEYQAKESAIAAYAVNRTKLELLYDYLVGQRDKQQALSNLLRTASAFIIEGWLPERVSEEVEQRFTAQWNCVLEIREPAPDEDFPVLLENNSLGASVEGITAMYGLPNCREVDPNTVMAPFFIGFFGLMLGDGGYGLIMTLASLFVLWKFDLDESLKRYAKLVMYCGISTMFWGLMFGSWFGIAYFSERPVWLNPVENPEEMLKWSLLFGVIHIFVGIGMRGVNYVRKGKYLDILWDVVAWYVLFIGFILYVLPYVPSMNLEDPSYYVNLGKKVLLVGAVTLILTQGREKKGVIAKLISGVGSLYDLVGFLSDVLSYSRLFALGLATSVIGAIVNDIATMAGLNNIIKILITTVILIIGHSINFGINALGAYVHSSRLQYIEFFGKFYQSGGKPFKPLKYNTKYVNLKN